MQEKEIAMPPLPEEEVAVEQVEETKPEQVVEPEAVKEQEIETQKESSKEINFKNLRLKNEQLEREHTEALRRLKEYESPKNKVVEEDDLDINIGDDDLFEGKHYKKIQKQLKKQQEEIRKYQNQVQLTATEVKLKAQYPDFDKVINEDNINRLREAEPEISEAIASTQDTYSKAVTAYKMIKKLGIYVEDNFEQERQVAQKNALKPKPLASVAPQQGESPLTRANAFANGLTPELKQQLWKEMQESSKGA